MNIAHIYGRHPVTAATNHQDGEAIFGVELEIEGITDDPEDFCGEFVLYKEDGSLRNNGYEFVTYPLHKDDAITAVNGVLKHFQFNTDIHFSERTSTHVHVNVGDMNLHQLAAMLLAYQVVERLMFDFAQCDRDKNIFCVPLSECATSYQAAQRIVNGDLVSVVDNWRKYTAFNLSRLPEICTVEFRHLAGTPDINKVAAWITMLKHLRDFAFTSNYPGLVDRINSLNTSSAYAAFATDVLGDLPWWNYNRHAPMLEEGVLTAKYSLMKAPVRDPFKIRMPNLNNLEWRVMDELANENMPMRGIPEIVGGNN